MPVARYFLFVGAVLLALLFALDAFAPQQLAVADNTAPSINKTVVRIRSDQKLPERVVFDTSLPTIVPPAATTRIAAAPAPAAAAADVSAQAQLRDTFTQFVPAEAKKLERQPEPQAPRKRKITKIRPAQPMRIAQQPHFGFGFFGSNTW
jgi:hypothetical protein